MFSISKKYFLYDNHSLYSTDYHGSLMVIVFCFIFIFLMIDLIT